MSRKRVFIRRLGRASTTAFQARPFHATEMKFAATARARKPHDVMAKASLHLAEVELPDRHRPDRQDGQDPGERPREAPAQRAAFGGLGGHATTSSSRVTSSSPRARAARQISGRASAVCWRGRSGAHPSASCSSRMAPGSSAAGGAAGDGRGARVGGVEDAAGPGGHPVARAARPERGGGASESVGRSEQARHRARPRGRLGRALGAAQLVLDVPRAAEDQDPVVVAVAGELVAVGDDAAHELGVALGLAAQDEEGGARARLGEGVEDGRRQRPRPVVEGQRRPGAVARAARERAAEGRVGGHERRGAREGRAAGRGDGGDRAPARQRRGGDGGAKAQPRGAAHGLALSHRRRHVGAVPGSGRRDHGRWYQRPPPARPGHGRLGTLRARVPESA